MSETEWSGPFVTIAILVMYLIALSFWPQMFFGDDQDDAGPEAKLTPEAAGARRPSPPPLSPAAAALRAFDPSFDEERFRRWAARTYERVLKAFGEEDVETLTLLLNEEVLKAFKEAIAERHLRQETLGLSFIGMGETSIADIDLSGDHVEITVRFRAEISRARSSLQDGLRIARREEVLETCDLWTFARNPAGGRDRSSNPGWRLIATDEAASAQDPS
jgi:predicted lipid-binding transport protein (Tim44 family)